MNSEKKKKPDQKLIYEKPMLLKLTAETAYGGCKTGSVASGVCGVGAVPSSNCASGTAAA